MGPRLKVDHDEFLRKCESSGNKVVVVRSSRLKWLENLASGWFGRVAIPPVTYIVRDGDYFYYTHALRPLDLPTGLEIETVERALL